MISDKLSDRRKELGMSIDALVEASGVPKGTLTKILTGVTPNPSLENAKAIAYALGMTLQDLDDEAGEMVISEDARELAEKFDRLDAHGKRIVQAVLDLEYERCTGQEPAEV